MEISYENQAKIFRSLCDEKRLRILELLRNGENCGCVLVDELDIAQSSLSYHMKILCDSGIITCRKDGKWSYYTISEEGSNLAQSLLKNITTPNAMAENECHCKGKSEKL